VPRSIATEELLPGIQRNPGFLTQGNYTVLDATGKHIDAAGIDWRALSTDNFRFTLVQQPGPSNQLGRIKFVFPNEYSVYMHDTPARHLFDQAKRAFSHGCVRVDKPLSLAEAVLAADGWTRERIETQVESGETRSVHLSRPLPTLLLYWTAVVDDQGRIYFYEDIYKRDAAVITALDRPVPGVTYRPD
jgi:murein L,D-transpeptidase YcbB/YkuD